MAVVKCRELQVIAATAVGATISWLRQYLGRFGETYLEGVIFLEANCQCSCLNGFLVMKPMRIWALNRNLFVVFLHWKLKRCIYIYICISTNSNTVLPKTARVFRTKPQKSPWFFVFVILAMGFFPIWDSQVSGRYRGFTTTWVWVAYYWKSEGGVDLRLEGRGVSGPNPFFDKRSRVKILGKIMNRKMIGKTWEAFAFQQMKYTFVI